MKTLQKCKENPSRFLKFCTILGPNGDQEFKPFRWQKKVLKSFKETAFDPESKNAHILIAPRQSGKTTLIAAYALWYALFHNDRNVCIMAGKWAQANEILQRVKEIFRKLPEYMRLDTKIDRKRDHSVHEQQQNFLLLCELCYASWTHDRSLRDRRSSVY